MRPAHSLHIPQPCHENWGSMTPTATGRHCAACAQTVVDFTLKTDAEILAYLAGAAGTRTCGRFAAGQLERPLQRAAPVAPTARWHAWLGAAVIAWSTHNANSAVPAPVQKSSIVDPRTRPHKRTSVVPRYVSGTVRDSVTQQPVKGVAVFLRNENRSTVTDSTGYFRLRLTTKPLQKRMLVLHRTGYLSRTESFTQTTSTSSALVLTLRPDPTSAGVEVVGESRSQARTIVMGMMPLPTMSVAQPSINSPGNWWQQLFHRN